MQISQIASAIRSKYIWKSDEDFWTTQLIDIAGQKIVKALTDH